jgi:alkanesulfonate monooxygenase SsuD/methylene tetrahydromethanopterin reductase-like flavin-dependent oxidoreductase (luciferase family)
MSHGAEFTRQTEHLHLHSTGKGEAVWTEHPDTKHAPTVATIGYGAAMAPRDQLPAVSIVATPTKRGAILDIATRLEDAGFPALACPSLGGTLGLCVSLAHRTSNIRFFTSIQPIYYNHPVEAANTVAHIHEVSGGRFGFGIGVSHGPVVERLGVQTGKPLSDIRNYVAAMRKQEQFSGQLPPIYLATMRDKMLSLAGEIADGAIWANSSLSNTPRQLSRHTGEFADGFMLTNMIPTVIDDDIEAARAINRKTMRGYVILPNYRNYWREAGYAEEMDAIEKLIAEGRRDELPSAMSNRWLDDCTLSGSVDRVREGLAAWYAAGVMPVAVMSSTSGGQAHAIGQLIDAYR